MSLERSMHRFVPAWIVTIVFVSEVSGESPATHPCSADRLSQDRLSPARCEFRQHIEHGLKAYCSGALHENVLSATNPFPRSLVVCFWPAPHGLLDPAEVLPPFLPLSKKLRRLVICYSNVSALSDDFPPGDSLEELILSGLGLTWLSETAFASLPRLRHLDLSFNQLTVLQADTLMKPPSLQRARLRGNPWLCALELAWLLEDRAARLIVDAELLRCSAARFGGKPVIPVVSLLQQLSAQCPTPTCACHLVHVVNRQSLSGSAVGASCLVPVVTVNCSGRGLKKLPEVLPELPASNTTLDVSNNEISSLTPLATLPQYERVQDLILDDNLVDNIGALEGTAWLMSFRVLSLRRNLLQQLPTYAFDNALARNRHAIRIYLGGNPWRCDCSFTPTFQDLLIKYATLMTDLNDVKCAEDGSENSLKQIRCLTRRAVCQDGLTSAFTGSAALDVVNGILATLIVLVFARLGYDYYHYKRSGKLPWIAARLL